LIGGRHPAVDRDDSRNGLDTGDHGHERAALVELTRCRLHIDDHAGLVAKGRVLFVRRFELLVAAGGRHRRIRIGGADLLVPAHLLTVARPAID
jgi:hypothetical protein